jgi:aminoglycoside phosphotransferase (APT) family kinase protein
LFEYQRNELAYAIEGDRKSAAELILHFLRALDRLDIWDDCDMWKIVPYYREQLDRWQQAYEQNGITDYLLADAVRIWTGLVSLAHNYEELCREWFLPTHLSQFLSYPPSTKSPGESIA